MAPSQVEYRDGCQLTIIALPISRAQKHQLMLKLLATYLYHPKVLALRYRRTVWSI